MVFFGGRIVASAPRSRTRRIWLEPNVLRSPSRCSWRMSKRVTASKQSLDSGTEYELRRFIPFRHKTCLLLVFWQRWCAQPQPGQRAQLESNRIGLQQPVTALGLQRVLQAQGQEICTFLHIERHNFGSQILPPKMMKNDERWWKAQRLKAQSWSTTLRCLQEPLWTLVLTSTSSISSTQDRFTAFHCKFCWGKGRTPLWPPSKVTNFLQEEYIEYIRMYIPKKTNNNAAPMECCKRSKEHTELVEFGRFLLPSSSEWRPVLANHAHVKSRSIMSPPDFRPPSTVDVISVMWKYELLAKAGKHPKPLQAWATQTCHCQGLRNLTLQNKDRITRSKCRKSNHCAHGLSRTIRLQKGNAALTALQQLYKHWNQRSFYIILHCINHCILHCIHVKIAGATSSSAVAKRAGDLDCKVVIQLWHRHRLLWQNLRDPPCQWGTAYRLQVLLNQQCQIWITKMPWKMI